ncbi:Nucleic-acid-binding protein from transposon X-element [Eumeta japonica]|uniref:Nucleic-acid-binding protein from transposon X-element n=1 Tax=Eumeta variegata TaxID=151549 RepID=A0A4C1XUK0_EUMVA|nr:Nucleic-acid-binding protein from transposon X-element [Eumeta japonica]
MTSRQMISNLISTTKTRRAISRDLTKVCGLSGIRVENPHKKGSPGQCHHCQRYGHASANCHAQPRCVKCLVPHWTKECPLTKESAEKPSCVNCGANHTANYKGCPKAPKVIPRKTHKTDVSHASKAKLPPVQNNVNFPSLGAKKPIKATDDGFVPAPVPSTNPWGRNQPPRAEPESPRAINPRDPRRPPSVHSGPIPDSAAAFAADIQTVMSVLRVIKSSEISEFARDIRCCRNNEENSLSSLNTITC